MIRATDQAWQPCPPRSAGVASFVQVYNTYTLEPGGETLEQIAKEAELW